MVQRSQKRHGVVSVLVPLAFVFAFVFATAVQVQAGSSTKAALVTFSVNDYGSVLGAKSASASQLVEQNMRKMVELSEESLAQYWTVVKVETFIANETYRGLSIGKIKDGLYGAEFDGLVLPSFTADRGQIIKCVLDKGTAERLCQVLGVDVVVVVYTEWTVASGKFVPTNKALAKNCVAVYNSSGKQLFFARKDVVGKMTLGAMGNLVLDENTITEWVMAYREGLDVILAKKAKKVK